MVNDMSKINNSGIIMTGGRIEAEQLAVGDGASVAVTSAATSGAPPTATDKPATNTKILFLGANPLSSQRLGLDEEARALAAILQSAEHREQFELKTHWAVRPDDLLQILNRERPLIVHFSGHGTGSSGLVLHHENGEEILVSADALRRLFTVLKGDIRLVVLTACASLEQARAIAEVIDCAIGMTADIADVAAARFSTALYRALCAGRSVQNAFDQGVTALSLAGLDGGGIPVLLARDGVAPDSIYAC